MLPTVFLYISRWRTLVSFHLLYYYNKTVNSEGSLRSVTQHFSWQTQTATKISVRGDCEKRSDISGILPLLLDKAFLLAKRSPSNARSWSPWHSGRLVLRSAHSAPAPNGPLSRTLAHALLRGWFARLPSPLVLCIHCKSVLPLMPDARGQCFPFSNRLESSKKHYLFILCRNSVNLCVSVCSHHCRCLWWWPGMWQ